MNTAIVDTGETSSPDFRLLAAHANDILAMLDESGRIRYANPAALDVLGHAPESLLGLDVRALIHGDDKALVEASLARARAHPGEVVTTRCRVRHAAAGYRMLESRGSFHPDAALGWAMVLVARDVTTQYRRERLLRCWMDGLLDPPSRREQLFEACCEMLMEVLELDLTFTARKQADGTLRLLAHACKPCDLLKDMMAAELRWDEAGAGGCLADALGAGELRVYHADDPSYPYWCGGALCVLPLRSAGGVYGAQLLYSPHAGAFDDDETRALLSEFATQIGLTLDMLETQARLAMLGGALSAAANAIFITDRDGVIEWVNDAFVELTGFGREEAVGGHPRLLRSGLHDDAYYQAMRDSIRAGKPWQGEIVDRRKDGSYYTAQQTITPIIEGRRQIQHFVAIQQDISERKRLELEVRGLAKNIEHARLLERGQIARQIHDELGGSLASLRHDIEWLLARADDPAQRERIEIMLDLAVQSLAAARQVAAGLRPTLVEELGLGEALAWLVREFRQHHDLVVALDIAPELEQSLTPMQAGEAYRVVQECLTNVAKHAHATSVRVLGRVAGDSLVMEVMDDGVGTLVGAPARGTRGMAERAQLMGGRLEIERVAASGGTCVRLITPLRGKEATT